jgi:DNA-binding GntR family transcriptional regulator
VAEAIIARDAPAAVAAYREHLDHVRDTTIHALHELAG